MTASIERSPLIGIRLWDPWEPSAPSAIRLHATHPARPARRERLVRSPSGSHVLHSMPHIASSPEFLPTELEIELDDPSNQVLPLRLRTPLPCDGFWSDIGGALGSMVPAGRVPMFVHPRRQAPAGWICLRASLRRESDSAPVPWAVMEVRHGSTLVASGVSSPSGEVVAAFAPPAPALRPIGLPASETFDTRAWSFDVSFRWSTDRIGESSPALQDLTSQPAVAAVSDVVDKFKTVRCGPGETILSSGPGPASSTVILQA